KGLDTLLDFQSDGILLGFMEEGTYSEIDIALNEEEEIFLISDGMIDFEIEGEKRSDMELLKHKLHALKEKNEPTESIANQLFNKHTSQVDDCSFIIIKRKENEVE